MEFVPHTLGKQTKCYHSRVIPCKMNERIPPVTVSMQKTIVAVYLTISICNYLCCSLSRSVSIMSRVFGGLFPFCCPIKNTKRNAASFCFFFFRNRGFCTYMAREQVKDFQSGSHSRELATALFVRRSIDRNAQLKVWNRN